MTADEVPVFAKTVVSAARTPGTGFSMPWYPLVACLVVAAGLAITARKGIRGVRTTQAIRAVVPVEVAPLETTTLETDTDSDDTNADDTDAEFTRIMATLDDVPTDNVTA